MLPAVSLLCIQAFLFNLIDTHAIVCESGSFLPENGRFVYKVREETRRALGNSKFIIFYDGASFHIGARAMLAELNESRPCAILRLRAM